VVVASPRVFTAECKRAEQMRMVNAVVRFGEMVGGAEVVDELLPPLHWP
jgi:hypothetical protein